MTDDERIAAYKAYRTECRGCTLCGEDVVGVKKDAKPRPVPAYLDIRHCRMLIVAIGTEPEDHTRKQVAPLTGTVGTVVSEALKKNGLYGDPRVGFTTIAKCTPKNGNVRARVRKNCLAWFKRELELVDPDIVVLLGKDVAKVVVPEFIAAYDKTQPYNYLSLIGRTYLHWDHNFIFTMDPADVPKDKSGVYRVGSGDFLWFSSVFKEACRWFSQPHPNPSPPSTTSTTGTTATPR